LSRSRPDSPAQDSPAQGPPEDLTELDLGKEIAHDARRYVRRATASDLFTGGASYHQERLAANTGW
jgi:hypothetical protein